MSAVAVVFDLDDTLVDTSELLGLRETKKWKECVRQLSKSQIFPGILDTINALRERGIFIGIVTTSVSYYAENILRYHSIPYDTLVAYHDCPKHKQKPDPAPINLCLDRLDSTPDGAFGIGDSASDSQAYRNSGIPAWGAGWSSRLVKDASWDQIIETPELIVPFFAN